MPKIHKINHIEKNKEPSPKPIKKKDVGGGEDFEIQPENKIDNSKYIPQSLAVIKGKKYVVIKRPTVHQNLKKKSLSDKDIKKGKIVKTVSKDLLPKSNSLPSENINDKFCDHFLRNVSIGFEVLFHTFQYLTIKVTNLDTKVLLLFQTNVLEYF